MSVTVKNNVHVGGRFVRWDVDKAKTDSVSL